MEETRVTFDIARLAKELDFEGACNHYVCIGFGSLAPDTTPKPYNCYDEYGNVIGTRTVSKVSKAQPHIALLPTQSLLSKWIRNTYGLHVSVEVMGNDYDYPRYYYKIVDLKNHMSGLLFEQGMLDYTYEQLIEISYDDYDECFENGLKDALLKIKSITKK